MKLLKNATSVVYIRLLLVFTVCCIVFSLSAQFAGGDGTQANPWQIGRPDDINQLRNYLGADHNDKYYILTHDIDLGVAPWNEGEGWTPIGTTAALSFQGHLDGRGHTISNLTINRTAGNYHALFGYTVNATIINLGLKDVNITGNNYVAALIGRQDGNSLVQGCYVTGEVTGVNYVAGLVSYMRDAATYVYDCYSTALITCTATSTTYYAGGITSYQYGGQTRRSYATGNINNVMTSSNSGAVIGNLRAAGGTQSHLYWNTDTVFVQRGIGNLVASPGQTTAQLVQQETFTGFDFDEVWRIQNDESYPFLRWQGDEPQPHNLPPLLPPRNLTGTGSNQMVSLSWTDPPADFGLPQGYNVYRNDNRVNQQLIVDTNYQDTGLTNWTLYSYYVKAVYDGEESLPSATIMVAPVNFAGGSGTPDDPFIVQNADHLNGVRFTMDAHYRQVANIDLGVAPWNEGQGWLPIGDANISFTGSYDGNYFTISNLVMNRTISNAGLFGHMRGGRLVNISLRDIELVSTGGNVGGLIGYPLNSSIINCSSTGSVRGGSSVGGLVGRGNNNQIIMCYTKGSVTGTASWIGGLHGQFVGDAITDCYSTASVTGNQADIGGLVGLHFSGNTNRSYATGRVSATHADPNWANIGGLIGRLFGGTVTNSYWDTETSERETSQGGAGAMGRATRQMIYPYDEQNTYVGWNFVDTWAHDTERIVNNGYPVLYYEEVPDPVDINPPAVKIQMVDINEQRHARLTWQPIENANSYKVFVSDDPYAQNWGDPIAVIDDTFYEDRIDDRGLRFYRVVSSTQEP